MARINYRKPSITIASSLSLPIKSGSGLNAFRLGATLAQMGYEVTHFTYDWGNKYPRREQKQGVRILRAPFLWSFYGDTKWKLYLSVPFITLYYARVIHSSNLIILYGPMVSFRILSLCISIAKLFRKKVIYRSTMLGGDDISQLVADFPGSSTKRILNALDGYWALSPAFTQSYLAYLPTPEKVFESFQGVNTQQFFPISEGEKNALRNKYNVPLDLSVIVSVGYIKKRKGYDQTFDVLANIQTPFLYLVVGQYQAAQYASTSQDCKEMEQLYQAGQTKLGSKIQFLGERDNVSELLQLSDIFLINSRQEGVPNVLLEAMACGLGIATRSIPGVNGVLIKHAQNAEVFSTKEEMKTSVEKLINNSKYRQQLGNFAHQSIEAQYSLKIVAQKIVDKFLN